jgi:hypothetical protein
MSTHALITIKDEHKGEIHLYRHMDGYPKGTMPSLEKLMSWVKAGRIPSSEAGSVAGWLLLIGRDEYKDRGGCGLEPSTDPTKHFYASEFGSYELVTTKFANMIGVDHKYKIDLTDKTITHEKA